VHHGADNNSQKNLEREIVSFFLTAIAELPKKFSRKVGIRVVGRVGALRPLTRPSLPAGTPQLTLV
jgi:hypothetical protein